MIQIFVQGVQFVEEADHLILGGDGVTSARVLQQNGILELQTKCLPENVRQPEAWDTRSPTPPFSSHHDTQPLLDTLN